MDEKVMQPEEVQPSKAKKCLRSFVRGVFPGIAWAAVVVWCLIFLLLIFWAFINSLKSYINFYQDPLFFPKTGKGYGWNFSNYVKAFSALKVMRNSQYIEAPQMLLNSLIYAGGSGVLSVITACLASYVLAKYSYLKWVRSLWAVVLITNYLPISSSLAANIKLLTDLGLYDSMIGIMLWQCGAFGYIFLIYYATWKSVSWSYAEAAYIDGASDFKIFVRIMLPLAKGPITAIAIITFIGMWNDYVNPALFLPKMPTLAVGLQQMIEDLRNKHEYPHIFSGVVIALIPVMAVYIGFSKIIMNNTSVGGLKG